MELLALAVVVLGLLVLIQAATSIEILRQMGELRRMSLGRQGAMINPTEGLSIGAPIPIAAVVVRSGQSVSLIGPVKTLLLMLTTDCGVCQTVAASLREAEPDELRSVRTIFVIKGGRTSVGEFVSYHRLNDAVVAPDDAGETAEVFGVKTYPSAVVIDEGGHVAAQGIINSVDQALALVQKVEMEEPAAQLAAV